MTIFQKSLFSYSSSIVSETAFHNYLTFLETVTLTKIL